MTRHDSARRKNTFPHLGQFSSLRDLHASYASRNSSVNIKVSQECVFAYVTPMLTKDTLKVTGRGMATESEI